MKKFLQFIIFLIYTIMIFYLKKFLIIILLINIILIFVLKINLKKVLVNLIKISGIVLFTTIINIIIVNLETGLLIGIRLLLVCNTTYIFSQNFNYMDLAKSIEKLFCFIKIFKVEPRNIGLIICISVAFIPILNHEIYEIKNSLKARGFNIKITKLNLILQPFFTSIFKRVANIEEALISKGIQEY